MTEQEYCAWAGEMVDEDEHGACICKECSHCGDGFTSENKWELEVYNSCWLHKKCVIPYLEDNGDLTQPSEDD